MKGQFARISVVMVVSFVAVSVVSAQDWDSVDYMNHSTYQAVSPSGSSVYSDGYPIRFVGVVLNNNENWLNPASAYDSGVHLWEMGGQAEIYVQAVNLDGTAYDTNASEAYNDSNGTACWIGQNYGNHILHQDPSFNYTESQWYDELDRLGMWYAGSLLDASMLVRAGDLVEVRVRAGMAYNGKNNVNERHENDSAYDYEIVILQKGYGLPDAAEISLSNLKNQSDEFMFDATRQSGGELYQSTLVEITNVRFTDVVGWGPNGDFMITDDMGRTLMVHIGLDDAFDSMMAPELTQLYNLKGILDQASSTGTDGYRLLITDASYMTIVPEPASICVLSVAMLAVLKRKQNHSRRV